MKNLQDRRRPFFQSQWLADKKAVLIAPAAEGAGDADRLAEAFRRRCVALHRAEMAGAGL